MVVLLGNVTTTRFSYPTGIRIDSNGDCYIADQGLFASLVPGWSRRGLRWSFLQATTASA
jgi:hypothetical protein